MEFNDLTDDERTDLQDQIQGLAWAFARRAAGFGGASPYDRALLRLADSQRVAETADLTRTTAGICTWRGCACWASCSLS